MIERFDQCKVTNLERWGFRTWLVTITDDSYQVPMAHLRMVKRFTRKAAQQDADLICFLLNAEKSQVWP